MPNITAREAQRTGISSGARPRIRRVGIASWTVHHPIRIRRNTGVTYVSTNFSTWRGRRICAPSMISSTAFDGPNSQTKTITSKRAQTTRPKVPAQ